MRQRNARVSQLTVGAWEPASSVAAGLGAASVNGAVSELEDVDAAALGSPLGNGALDAATAEDVAPPGLFDAADVACAPVGALAAGGACVREESTGAAEPAPESALGDDVLQPAARISVAREKPRNTASS